MHRSILTGLLLLGAVAVHGTKRPSRREVEVAERSELSSDKMGAATGSGSPEESPWESAD